LFHSVVTKPEPLCCPLEHQHWGDRGDGKEIRFIQEWVPEKIGEVSFLQKGERAFIERERRCSGTTGKGRLCAEPVMTILGMALFHLWPKHCSQP
jgi:hypothetical protein